MMSRSNRQREDAAGVATDGSATEGATAEGAPNDGVVTGRGGPNHWLDLELQRRLARSVLLACLLVTIVVGGLLVVGLVQVRSGLEAARGELGELRAALGDVEVERASAVVASADAELRRARSWTESALWSMASYLPIAGRSLEMTRDVVEVGDAAVDIARIAVSDGEQLLGGDLDLAMVDGRVDLAPLLATRELIEGLPIARLEAARDSLAAPREGWIPAELIDGRTETLALAGEVLDAAALARSLTTSLPGFLGADGERQYFVGVQTSAELRGTGGLIGYFGILTVDDGAIEFGSSDALELEDGGVAGTTYYGELNVDRDQHLVDAEPEFAARYAGVGAMSNFANVNVDPDLPSTARVALDLFSSHTGQRLDGMILLDPVGVERLLTVTGSEMALDEQVATSLGLDGGVATDRFAELATVGIYERLGSEHTSERRLALRTLGDAAFAQVFAGGWSSAEMVRAVADASGSRHLQVFSEQPDEQEAFTAIGVAGALPNAPGQDALALVANNAVGGKQDVHLGHEFAVQVALGDVRQRLDGTLEVDRSTALQVTVDNPLPSSGMDEYIIGNCVAEGEPESCFLGEPGLNWTWFSAFLPAGTRLVDASTDELSQPLSNYGPYHGFHLVDHFQATPSESRGTFELELEGRAPLQRTADAIVYELLWWRQAKATPDLLDVVVTPPPGWVIADLEVVGGGHGRGSGVHGAGVALDAEVADGAAHLRGTVTADTALRVHLVRVED